MSIQKTLKRDEINSQYKWSINEMYPDEAQWDKDIEEILMSAENFDRFRGHVADSTETLLEVLEENDRISRKLYHAYVYASSKKDEDNRVSKYVAMCDKIHSVLAKVNAGLSFVTPELLEASEEKILNFLSCSDKLSLYEFYIKDLFREKAHILSASEENIAAQLGEAFSQPRDLFRMLNNAEMNFGETTDESGKKVQLTHGNYGILMQSSNREVRKEAYRTMYTAYEKLINTISLNLNSANKNDVIIAKMRKYDSARQASLSNGNIPESVYDNLISVVHEYLPVFYKYVELRKKALGVDELKFYDVYAPLFEMPDKEYTFDEAVELCKAGVSPLGADYVEQFEKAIKEEGWVDIYENEGKTSGAYSTGSYDSRPYILMNYNGTLNHVFTLVHEMGHSMHSFYTNANQPYVYSDYSIFVAEVASTVNENLLIQHLIKNEKDVNMKKYLLNHYLEDFKGTLFRQTMFAEFELMTHREVENGGTLTAEWLCETYEKLNKLYFGPSMSDDEFIKYEWARIPHFYTDFYVYQYATGYSAANAISSKILSEGPAARDNYKKFLSSGSSDYPVEVLKLAGVDMSSPEPVIRAMETFKSLVLQLEELL